MHDLVLTVSRSHLGLLRVYGVRGVARALAPTTQMILLNYTSWDDPIIVIDAFRE